MNPAWADVDTVNAPGAYVDTVHAEPQGPAAGALLSGVLALLVVEEVGADEGGVFATEGGFVPEEAAAGCAGESRYGGSRRPSPGRLPVTPGSWLQQSQQWLDEAGDRVQHVINSCEVGGHAPGPSLAVAGIFRTRGQVDTHVHRSVAMHLQSETSRATLARGSEVTTHLSHGS